MWFGKDVNDTSRSLHIRQSLSRGKYLGKPKSGRERRVAMSRRLRSALLAWQMEQGRRESGRVVSIDAANLRNRHFRRVCKAAEITLCRPKDLRDTYASQLLTAGVQLGYVSNQLGHADVAVTATHYARWTGREDYRQPIEVGPGEVPADLLARIPSVWSQNGHNRAPAASPA